VTHEQLVVVTEHLSDAAMAWLRERCRVESVDAESPRLSALLGAADGLIVRTYTNVNRPWLDNAPNLRVVGRAGVGLDNIDLAECRARNIKVVYTPEANTHAVVEYVIRLLLGELRPIHRLAGPVDSDAWRRLRAEIVGDRQLSDLTFGVMGFGRIGSRVARIAQAFDMPVIFNDLEPISSDVRGRAEPVDTDHLFSHADVLSVHIDGRPENRSVIDNRLIQLMKENVIFINTSRGFVVDHAGLASFLNAAPNAVALLDVHETEPVSAENPLLDVPNAKLFPHLASRTKTAMENMSWVVRDVWSVLEGQPPRFPAPREHGA